jgi:hypothetical protein
MTARANAASAPLEEIAARLGAGELTLQVACELATQPAIVGCLTPAYAAQVAGRAESLTRAGDHAPAMALGELLLTAAATLPVGTGGPAQDLAGLAWIRVVTAALPSLPDWRRHQAACAAGDRLLARAQAAGDDSLAAVAHEALARLHFAPLVAPFTGNYEAWRAVIAAWYRRGNKAAGAVVVPYPPPEHSFPRARDHFAQAAARTKGRARGRALAGEVNALEWTARVANAPAPSALVELAVEALPLLDPLANLADVTYLLAICQRAGHALDRQILERAARAPVEQLIDALGPADTVQCLLNLSYILGPIDRRLALATVVRGAPALVAAADANLMARHSSALIDALIPTLFEGAVSRAGGAALSPAPTSRLCSTRGYREG